jgi:mRNA-degrading endonuclease toxin of MazEF toxin-antitoxin module
VISADVRNALRDHVIVVPIFSSGRLGPTRVALSAGTGGLDHDSVVFCDEVTTLHHSFMGERPLGSRVPAGILREVVRAIRRAVGDVVTEPDC